MITIDEAIARENKSSVHNYEMQGIYANDYGLYAKEYAYYDYEGMYHQQLAEWLEELKKLRLGVNYLNERAYQQGRADAIDECKQMLKAQHIIRTSEDDFDANVEIPFYRKLWDKFEQLKENKE